MPICRQREDEIELLLGRLGKSASVAFAL